MIKKFKKTISRDSGGGTCVSMAPVTESTVKAADLPEVTAHYNMTHSGNQLLDVSGNNRHATLV